MKTRGPLFAFVLFAMLTVAALFNGCGVWDHVTGAENQEVTLKGETGASCTVDSECRSNSCVYPGRCE